MNIKLKPCPFCGGSVELHKHKPGRFTPEGWSVGHWCDGYVMSSFCSGATVEEAAARWNQRIDTRWISAKEKKPTGEEGDWVLGVATGQAANLALVDAEALVSYDEEADEWYLTDVPDTTVHVSWWMPLPEPPELPELPEEETK